MKTYEERYFELKEMIEDFLCRTEKGQKKSAHVFVDQSYTFYEEEEPVDSKNR